MTLQASRGRLTIQGERARMARAATKLGRDAFAKAVSELLPDKTISRGIIEAIETGHRDAEMGILIAISILSGKKVEWLAGGLGVPSDSDLSDAPVAQVTYAFAA